MEYAIDVIKWFLNGDHFVVSLCLTLMGLMISAIVMLFKEVRARAADLTAKDELMNAAYDQLADLNERYSNSVDKSAANNLQLTQGLSELMVMFGEIMKKTR